MKNKTIILGLSAISFLFFHSCSSTSVNPDLVKSPAGFSKQLIVVETDGWNSNTGIMQYFEREKAGTDWKSASSKIEIAIGKKGLAWGTGLHGGNIADGPIKKEGDGKSPAGAFNLSAVFGYAKRDSVEFLKMPYIVADPNCFCIDDPNSKYYNLVLDSLQVADADWKSRERMKLRNDLYKWGIVINHNSEPRVAGDGSCIFFHTWNNSNKPTEGCTVLDQPTLLKMIKWLDKEKNPIVVQLPKAEYERVKTKWNLP